jgi:hypothetical protein
MDATHKGWLGNAVGNWFIVVGGANNGTLYARWFEHGIVIVNPTNYVQSYYGGIWLRSISAPFPEYKAELRKAWTIQPRDARFLLNQ